jgi:L-ascorbate metabolism protein UlaG (beta-lactamase superfamily)
MEANPGLTVIVPRANIGFAAERLRVSSERLTPIRVDSRPLVVGPFSFEAIPSAHESIEQDENGDHRFIGLIVKTGNRTIYHSGDCVNYDGLAERLEKEKIDIALLPINGHDPVRGVAGNFSGEEAARLGKQIHAGMIIPCHYDMFEFNTVSPETFIKAAKEIRQEYALLKCGQRLDL